jgi:hypothetical protein
MGLGVSAFRWVAAAAEHRGKGHVRSGLPCQDAARVTWREWPATAVVADGAGSARHSDVGARVTTTAVETLLLQQFDELALMAPREVAARVVAAAIDALTAATSSGNLDLQDLASTLMFVATDGVRFIAGSLGDGVIATSASGAVRPLFKPQKGEFANETVMVTSTSATARMDILIEDLADIDGFAIFTDGTAESLYLRAKHEIAPAVSTLLGWLDAAPTPEVAEALSGALGGILSEKTSDDCSIALLRRVDLLALESRKRDVQLEILDLHHQRGPKLRYRLSALFHWANAQAGSPGGMHQRTFRKHLTWLTQHVVRAAS